MDFKDAFGLDAKNQVREVWRKLWKEGIFQRLLALK